MAENPDIGPIVKDLYVMTHNNDRLRARITERSPGAKDICDQQTKLLRELKTELGVVKKGGLWWRFNELLGKAHNIDPIVRDMIDSIEHPEAAKEAREWADRNLP